MKLDIVRPNQHDNLNEIRKIIFWKTIYSMHNSCLNIVKIRKYGISFADVHTIIPLFIPDKVTKAILF